MSRPRLADRYQRLALADVVARAGAGVVLGHLRGTPQTMQQDPHFDDVLEEVAAELRESVARARAAGVRAASIAVDPGIGFGKRPEDNLMLLVRPQALRARVGAPVPLASRSWEL